LSSPDLRLSRRILLAGLAAGLAAPAAHAGDAAAAPARIVSLNPCLDTVLVHVADRSQIAALSHYARQPAGSTIADLAQTLPTTFETAEEVVALRPDLVLASRHSALATRNALARLGVRVELFSEPQSVDESLAQVRRIAGLAGRPEAGEALVARIEAALAAAAPPPGTAPVRALIYQPNGFAAGAGTLADEMLRRTGFVNVAGEYGLRQWGNIPLESLIADPPDMLLAGESAPGAQTWAERVVTHPALAGLGDRMKRAAFPERLLYCGGPVLIQTAAVLAAARARVTGEGA
jgi:iron complex transport system substrate-binding protein